MRPAAPLHPSPTESTDHGSSPGSNGLLERRPRGDWLRAGTRLTHLCSSPLFIHLSPHFGRTIPEETMGRAARAKARPQRSPRHVGKWESLYLGIADSPISQTRDSSAARSRARRAVKGPA